MKIPKKTKKTLSEIIIIFLTMCAYPFPYYADRIGLLSISLSLSAYHTTLLPNYYYYYVALFIALSMMIVRNQLRSLSLSLSLSVVLPLAYYYYSYSYYYPVRRRTSS